MKRVVSLSKKLSSQIQLFFLTCDKSQLVSVFPGFVSPGGVRPGMDLVREAEWRLSFLCDKIAIETARNNNNTDNLAGRISNSKYCDLIGLYCDLIG